MKPIRNQQGGLARAHDRIEFLLHELNATVANVEQIDAGGDGREALRLIEEQRAMLFRTVEQIASDVARHSPSRFELFRKHLVSASAAALIAVGVVAGGVSALTRGNDPMSAAKNQLAHAATIADPAERLTVIVTVYRTTRALPESSKAVLDREIAEQARKTADDLDEGGDDDSLARQAEQIADDVQGGRMPAPPPAPSGDKPPSDTIEDLLKP